MKFLYETCHQPEYASLPPSQIVPRLADPGESLASEPTFYRLLGEADEQHHRGHRRAPREPRPIATHCAKGPCEVWSGDITGLPAAVKGRFFYLYPAVP
jgi:putative transposase